MPYQTQSPQYSPSLSYSSQVPTPTSVGSGGGINPVPPLAAPTTPGAEGQNLVSLLASQAAPTLAGYAAQDNQYQNQLNNLPAQYGIQNADLVSQAQLAQGQNAIQGQQNLLQQGLLPYQQAALTSNANLTTGQYWLNTAGNQQSLAQNALQYQRGLQSQYGSAAASGTTGTRGNANAISDINQQYGPQGWNAQSIQRQQSGEDIAYQNAQTQQQLAQQNQNVSAANLKLAAESNNMSSQQITAGLQSALDQSGLSQFSDVNTILNAMANVGDEANQTLLQAIAPYALAQGINPYGGS